MNEDFIIVVNFKNICRLCLQTTDTLSDIFTACGGKSLQQQILCIIGLSTKNGDGLPSKICHRCRHIVEQASELRDLVEKSQKILEKAVLDNVEQGSSDTEPFDNETFLQSLSDTNIDQENVKTENFFKIQDATFEKYVCNESEILPNAPFNELNAKFFTEGQDLLTEIPAEVQRAKVDPKPPADLVCQICLSQFASKEEVRPHVEQHYVDSNLQIYLDLNAGPFLCTFCDEIQVNKAQLVKHHRRHLHINPFVCKEPGCKFVGKNTDAVRKHMVVHAEVVSRSTCGACGLRAVTEPALRLHKRAHHNTPQYPCPLAACERTYPTLPQLREHEATHAGGERPHRCQLCSAGFLSSTGLIRHIKEKHAHMVTCAKCPLRFEQHAAYYRHWVAHHGPWEPHRCRACNQGYPAESQLLTHERTCERLKSLLTIITEHNNGRTRADSGHSGELSGDEPLNGDRQDFDQMEQGDDTDRD